MKGYQFLLLCGALLACGGAVAAVDAELMEQYRAHKARQQAQLVVEQEVLLEQARAAVGAGDLNTANARLADLREYGHTPAALAELERQIAAEQDRQEQERRAREERERQERIAREERARQERLAAAAREQTRQAEARSRVASLESSLNWGYGYNEVYVPPTYETKLRDRGIFFREYYLETTQSTPGFTISDLEKVYFAVRLKNPSDRPVQVTYRITAREEFSVGRAVGTTVNAAGWGFVGAMVGSLLTDGDRDAMKAGAALGGAYGVGRQAERNEWFEKSKSFTLTLGPGEETYETGIFPVSKRLAQAPTLEIVRVD
jgi:hypothetical protein